MTRSMVVFIAAIAGYEYSITARDVFLYEEIQKCLKER